MQELLHLVRQLLCLFFRCLLVQGARGILRGHNKPPLLNKEWFPSLCFATEALFFNSSSKFGMNHVFLNLEVVGYDLKKTFAKPCLCPFGPFTTLVHYVTLRLRLLAEKMMQSTLFHLLGCSRRR